MFLSRWFSEALDGSHGSMRGLLYAPSPVALAPYAADTPCKKNLSFIVASLWDYQIDGLI